MRILKEDIDGIYSERMYSLIQKCEEEKNDYIYYIARKLTQYLSEGDMQDLWKHYDFDKIFDELFPAKGDSIQDWYVTVYPTDELGDEIDSDATFSGLYEYLKNNMGDTYAYIAVDDSVIRERVEGELCRRFNLNTGEAENLFDSYNRARELHEAIVKANQVRRNRILSGGKNYTQEQRDAIECVKNEEWDKWEAKRNYVDRLMRKNAEVEGLTEEQHEALEWLARWRHEVHCEHDTIWEVNEDSEMADILYGDAIEDELSKAGLPPIKLPDITDSPTSQDYYEVLTDNERDEWERRAEDETRKAEAKGLRRNYGGYEIWLEESGDYEYAMDMLEHWNDVIEEYLRNIDKKYGTQYAPTGIARMRY